MPHYAINNLASLLNYFKTQLKSPTKQQIAQSLYLSLGFYYGQKEINWPPYLVETTMTKTKSGLVINNDQLDDSPIKYNPNLNQSNQNKIENYLRQIVKQINQVNNTAIQNRIQMDQTYQIAKSKIDLTQLKQEYEAYFDAIKSIKPYVEHHADI